MCSPGTEPLSLDQTLEQLRSHLGETLTDTLQPILHLNEKRCRIQRHLALHPHASVQSYVVEVATRYQADYALLCQIQQHKSAEAWDQLLDKLRRWAYSFINSWNLDESTRLSYTTEIAQEASLEIIRAHYPYDCEFDAWACTLTKNISSKYMQQQPFFNEVDHIDLSDIEEWFSKLGEQILLTNPEIEIARRQSLLDAIAQLSDKQKDLIWKRYFEGWSLPEISAHSQISISAVYKRHFDALQRLRKILDPDWHKDEQH